MTKYILVCFLTAHLVLAQSFNVKKSGQVTFDFYDKAGRNYATFYSTTPLEDITGTANGISGIVTFNTSDFANTLKGEITVEVESINTGIELRNQHLRSKNWLNSKKYPYIKFVVKSVNNVKQISGNKLTFDVIGNFTLHGVTKEIIANAEAIYLEENEETKKRAEGDLLGIRGKFFIMLSDFNIDNQIIGSKVAEKINIEINMIGVRTK
ncbi:YceI family protein [Rosettibacter firmus]|uniref:YceI family protein n=1 Tax=Rosettibacter firmus TaxID=3111522 RepID=UPI00336BB22A